MGLLFAVSPANPGFLSSDEIVENITIDPPFLSSDTVWVDSLMNVLSLEEKIGQLMMVQAYSNRDAAHLEELLTMVDKWKIGGVIFFQGGPVRQALMTNALQEASEIPLLVAMDAEWGLGMRLDSVISYPRQMMLGALRNNNLIYRMGQDIGSQLHDLGVHMNFAPVADINNNPGNPVINTRSFGEDRYRVSDKLTYYFTGLHDKNILVTAKHFPGHGDTDVDSHHDLPVINFDRNRLDSMELFPFRHAINNGVSGIMVAHLQVPVLDDRENRPVTLSEAAVSLLLKREMKFKGLVVTDAMNMKGVSNHFSPGDAELEAIKAGNDIILMPSDLRKTIKGIKRAVRNGEITAERIDASCRKVLLAKSWAGLDSVQFVETDDLVARLNARSYLPLQHEIAEQAITLVRDRDKLIPLKGLETLQLATFNFGVEGPTAFTNQLDKYHSGDHFYYHDAENFPSKSELNKLLSRYNTLIVGLYYTRSYGNNYDIPAGLKELLNAIDFNGDMIVNLFGYPYALPVLGGLQQAGVVMVSYTTDRLNQQYAAQGIFGGTSLSGTLPVSAGMEYPAGTGTLTAGGTRLSYGCPEAVSMQYDTLKRIEEIIDGAIMDKAMPGCQVLVARKGKVVWNRSYGYHTYLKRQPVRDDDLYDLASITKIASSIPAIMKLQDQQLFSVDSTLGEYLQLGDTSAKAGLVIRDVLTHQAGLRAWIPFYTKTLEPMDTAQQLFSNNFSYAYPYRIGPAAFANRNIRYKDSVYERSYSAAYPLQVADELFLRADYRDSIYDEILRSPLGKKEYLYSDLGYYYLYRIVEKIAGSAFYPYLWKNFYGPIGAGTLGFLPLKQFSPERIVPTENDMIFRRQLIRGYVHDPGSAMLGGICGHAGLFSNANDLAKMMQIYLNHGSYGGERYIDSSTIAAFTRCQFCDEENRRGLGFDRPITEEEDA
ncbi:MAG: serine hydrolase, partial [Bacteroidales bacterium]|nr:serine hydrolase [Bacteroidales bacterium]